MKNILMLMVGVLATSFTLAASFDCTKARTKQEKMICNDAELSAYDSRLLPLYKKARKATGNSPEFRRNGKKSLQWRAKHCKDKTCLMKWYKNREKELIKLATHSSLKTDCLYDGKAVELTGKLVIKIHPGLPNFESIENGDTPMKMLTLQTPPYCAISDGEKLAKQTLFQLDNGSQKEKSIRQYINKTVTIKGTLAESILGWEYTPLILEVKEIK